MQITVFEGLLNLLRCCSCLTAPSSSSAYLNEQNTNQVRGGGGRDKRAEGKKIKILFLLVILAELSLNTITFYFDRFVLIRFGADDDSADGLLAADDAVVVVDVVFDHHHRDFFFFFFCFVSIQFGEEKKISTRAEN